MRLTWPIEMKKDLITEAETTGHAECFLGSIQEARLFRFSLYRLLKNKRLITTVDGNRLTLMKTPNITRATAQNLST